MPDAYSYDERKLLHELADGSGHAFTIIFNTYWPKVYSVALLLLKSEELAEDVSQEIFTRFWENRNKAIEIQDLESWLFISARNLVLNRLARMKVENAYKNYLLWELKKDAQEGENPLSLKDTEKRLINAVSELPPQQQRAFKLSREEGLTYKQIAEQMGIAKDTVKEYIIKALASLRKNIPFL